MRIADLQESNHWIMITLEVSHISQIVAVWTPGFISHVHVCDPISPLLRVRIVKESLLCMALI